MGALRSLANMEDEVETITPILDELQQTEHNERIQRWFTVRAERREMDSQDEIKTDSEEE